MASAHESVHLIVDSKQAGRELALARELTQSGFDVETLEEEAAVHKFNVTVVPQLVALFSGKIAYQGGYGRDQQHSEVYEDERILKKLVLNQNLKNTDQFSLFGCANGHLKKTKLDPFRIKYAN